jgi:uncharacterized protein (DUF486 family)
VILPAHLLADTTTVQTVTFDWLGLIEKLGLPIVVIVLLVRRILVIGYFYDQAAAAVVAKDQKIDAMNQAVTSDVLPALTASTKAVQDITTLVIQVGPVADELRDALHIVQGLITSLQGLVEDLRVDKRAAEQSSRQRRET